MSDKKSKKIKKPVQKGVAKVPVVMQLEALECGAASLAMVLAYYGKWIPLERVRYECGVSRDGSNAKNVLMVARNYGLEANGYRLEPDMLRSEGTFPCIVHWEFNHFIVVDGFKGNYVYVNDPAKGSYKMTIDRFDEGFTGIALLFEPTDKFEPSGKPKSMYSYATQHLKGAIMEVIFVTLTTFICSMMGIIESGFSRVFLDRLLTHKNPSWVPWFLAAMVIMAIIQIVMSWVQAVYSYQIDGKMAVSGSVSFMWRLFHLPMEFFSQRMSGDIQSRMEDNKLISSTIVNTVAPLILNFINMIFYLVVMIRYSIVLTLLGISSILINLIVARIISEKRVNITRVMMRDSGKLEGTTVSGIEMIETIKSSGAENGFFEKWSGYQASVNAQMVKYEKLQNLIGMIPTLVSEIMSCIVMIIGVFLVMNKHFTVGMVMAFQGFLTSFLAPASSMVDAGEAIQELRTQMERVDDIMKYPTDMKEEKSIEEDVSYAKLRGEIELKNVTFGYSRLAKPLIENFSMKLNPGAKVAFVGASGCGKSTLAKLISGLYKPWSGEILFDGKPIDEIDREVFTGSLSVVDQDITIFEDSIRDNIKMWDNTIEDFEMILAARDAQIHEDILKRDGGYSYKLLEGGKDFSGGQRQRMEIARVLASDPTVIILDEATSALDAKTEYDVVKAIGDRGISCIVVAHRLSTVRDCEEIIVLDQGKVVERGTHQQLYALDGAYKKLVSSE